MTPLPRPAHVDLADFTDGYIRALAYAVDAAIGSAVKVSVLPPTVVTADGNAQAMLIFPGLNAVSGALVAPAGATYVHGARTSYPPVPPASIGTVMLDTPAYAQVGILGGGGGQVIVRLLTMSTSRGTPGNEWGTQMVVPAGTKVTVCGVAWGPVG
jgi:hypothetical protein